MLEDVALQELCAESLRSDKILLTRGSLVCDSVVGCTEVKFVLKQIVCM
jgi:hypothetical protein